MQRKFTMAFHVPGSLSANLNIRTTINSDCELRHVSAVGSNANDATIDIGTSADTDGFLDGGANGDSNTPAEFELADFNGALITTQGKDYPRLSDGDILVIVVDYDGASGTAADDFTLVLTFAEG